MAALCVFFTGAGVYLYWTGNRDPELFWSLALFAGGVWAAAFMLIVGAEPAAYMARGGAYRRRGFRALWGLFALWVLIGLEATRHQPFWGGLLLAAVVALAAITTWFYRRGPLL